MSKLKNKKLLVTGAAGFIGANLTRRLLANGYEIIGLDALTYAGHRENLTGLKDGFRLVEGNILDQALLHKLFVEENFSAVLHLAAESHVDRSITGASIFLQTNIIGTHTLLAAALDYWKKLSSTDQSQFRFLQISTDEVYGSLGAEGFFSENTPLDPRSPYSASKAAGDHLASAWHHTYALPTIITRCTNNYGPYQFPEKLIPHMIRHALAGKALPVYGKGENIRDWIHVDDHCLGIQLALEKGRPGSTYCFGGHAEMQNLAVVKLICSLLDELQPRIRGSYAEQIAFVQDRLGHDFRYAIDDSFAQKELGYAPRQNFSAGIRATIAWYLANQNWANAVLQKENQ